MEIFRLFGTIFLKDDDVNKKLDGVDKKAEGVGSKLGSMIGTAAKWGTAIVTGAGVAAGGMLALVSKTSDAASEINDMSVRTGISTKNLQELKFATGQVGVNFEALTTASGKLTKFMASAAEGNDKAVETFDRLKIKTEDASGNLRSMDSILPELLSKLSDMPNATERNALAMQFFGKGALELAPLLANGSKGLDEMKQKANDLGLVLSEEAINANDAFGDSLDATKGSLEAVGMKIGTGLLPIAQSMLDWVMVNMPTIQAVAGTAFDVIGWGVEKVGSFVTGTALPAFDSFKKWIEPNMPTIKKLTVDSIDAIKKAFSLASDGIKIAIDWVIKYKDILIPLGVGVAAGVIAFGIYTLAIAAWTAVTTAATAVGTAFSAVVAFLTSPIGLAVIAIGLLVAAGVLLYKNWDVIKLKLSEFAGYMKSTFEGVKTSVLNVWDGITDGIKGAVNKIIIAMNMLIKGMNKIKFSIPEWVPGVGGKSWGINIDTIPMLAKGGDITRSGTALVGENGPELLDLPRGARVTPLDKAGGITINITDALVMDDYGVDRLMDRVMGRLEGLGVV